jgi:splicing suppressor protein 51
MAFSLVAHRSTARPTRLLSDICFRSNLPGTVPVVRRYLLNFLGPASAQAHKNSKEKAPILGQDNLFHPFSKSPFPEFRARGEAIKSLAPCPVCSSSHSHIHAHTKAQPPAVKFECPDCGWPTHCTEEHWNEDKEHTKYCPRLREANEDEHDLRSGRKMREFELPGELRSVLPWIPRCYPKAFL